MSKRTKLRGAAMAALGLTGTAQGAIQFSELQYNAPGANVGKRFFEVRSDTGGAESLSNVTLLAIEGDLGSGSTGNIDLAVSFGDVSTGANGLALLRDSTTVQLEPVPAAETTVVGVDYAYNENVAVTYLLVTDFTGMVPAVNNTGDDVDSDDDGVLNATLPFGSVLDAVGFRDNATDLLYAAASGGPEYDQAVAPYDGGDISGFLRDSSGTAHSFRSAGPAAGPFTVSVSDTLPVGFALTPGGINPAVPEPAALSLLGLAGLVLVRRSRRRA